VDIPTCNHMYFIINRVYRTGLLFEIIKNIYEIKHNLIFYLYFLEISKQFIIYRYKTMQ
jgi:hypothetical protein